MNSMLTRISTVLLIKVSVSAQLFAASFSAAEGELLIKWRDGPASEAARFSNAQMRCTVKRSFNEIGWQLVSLPPGMSVSEGVRSYQRLNTVLAVEPNGSTHFDAQPVSGHQPTRVLRSIGPNDPRYSSQWYLAKIGAPAAWQSTTGGTNVVIVVFDSGVDYTHPDLATNMWRNPGETGLDATGNDKATNRIDDDGNGYIDDVHGADVVNGTGDPMPQESAVSYVSTYHGTAVAGIIAAVGNNALGVTGLNWSAQIMAVRMYVPGDDYSSFLRNFWSDALAGYDYVIKMKRRGVNIRVTNTGYGIEYQSAALRDAIVTAGDEGILAVFPALNSPANQDLFSFWPAALHLESAISVAASTESDALWAFSAFGQSTVDLAAPGVNLTSTGKAPEYITGMNGTSGSCPLVAGAAALLLSANPNLSIAEIKAALFGSVDQPTALRGKVITNGRLNVARALEYLTNSNPPAIVIHASPVGQWTLPDAPIKVTFNRPMIRAAVESAFVINPSVKGAFTWADDNRSFSFHHELPFDSITNYTVRIRGMAQDESGATLDGNFNRTRENTPTDDFVWSFRFRIPNDDFANAQWLTGPSGSLSSSNRFAFQEADEPVNIFGDGQHYGSSVWYKWEPTELGGWVSFDLTAAGAAFDSLLAVYTGESLDSLKVVAANDNYGTRPGSRVSFQALRGTKYSLVVAAKDPFDPNQAGNFNLTWYLTPPPGFTSSQFSPASGVPGTKLTLTGTNLTGATAVLFNGASASFTNAPTNNVDLRITAVVPPDATSGPIRIVTPHGNVTSAVSFTVLPPPLTVRAIRASEFEIAWLATGNAFVLEISETLTSGSWMPVTQAPRVENGQSKVTLVAPVGNRFYRLKTQ